MMIIPRIPKNEEERVEALENSHLMHTPIEKSFERITNLTKKIFGVPIVAISLIDKDTQWFKSSIGIDLDHTPRETSFCGHAILEDEVLIVNDARKDIRFADNPFVSHDPSIRFYAGCPIHASENLAIGALCIIDTKPRKISDADRMILNDLANIVDQEIKKYQTIENYKQKTLALENSQKITLIDGLTRMWNKDGIQQLLQQQINFLQNEPKTFGFVCLSIDNFNNYINEFGYKAGNELLRLFAKKLTSLCNNNDAIGYCGSKEFMIIMPSEDKKEILTAVQKIQKHFAEDILELETGKYKTTVTIGLVFYNKNVHVDSHGLIEKAHDALEKGKSKLGNQINIG